MRQRQRLRSQWHCRMNLIGGAASDSTQLSRVVRRIPRSLFANRLLRINWPIMVGRRYVTFFIQ
jgi:hypothetical protein